MLQASQKEKQEKERKVEELDKKLNESMEELQQKDKNLKEKESRVVELDKALKDRQWELKQKAAQVHEKTILLNKSLKKGHLRTVPTIVIAHTFCASPDTRISYRQCLLIQGYFCAV